MEYNTHYIPRESIKYQALAYFVVELISPIDKESPSEWVLFVYNTSNVKVREAEIVIEGPSVIVIEQALKFEFIVNNNLAEYKAIIIDMVPSFQMGDF